MHRTPKPVLRCAVLLAFLLLPVSSPAASAQEPPSPLFPEIEPYDSGFLKVSRRHTIYYEQSGNPQGNPVFFLHGGPGGGSSPVHRRFFDPARFRIILHDQRGAGRSRPSAETRQNTTQNLVKDIERLRRHLKIDGKILLVGGSWGSTLALAYAEAHPERVAGMVLRGIWLCTPREIDHFYGDGVAAYFPELSERVWSQIPDVPGKTRPRRLLELLQSRDPEVRRRTARLLVGYESKIAFLERSDEEIEGLLVEEDLIPFALIETWYLANGCFLEPGQLLRDAHRIAAVPLVLLNGRYDVICPLETAWGLHKALPGSKLQIIEAAGHAGIDPRSLDAFLRAIRGFE